jgi:hypothetical protein
VIDAGEFGLEGCTKTPHRNGALNASISAAFGMAFWLYDNLKLAVHTIG